MGRACAFLFRRSLSGSVAEARTDSESTAASTSSSKVRRERAYMRHNDNIQGRSLQRDLLSLPLKGGGSGRGSATNVARGSATNKEDDPHPDASHPTSPLQGEVEAVTVKIAPLRIQQLNAFRVRIGRDRFQKGVDIRQI